MGRRILINCLLAFTLNPALSAGRLYIELDLLDDHSSYAGSWMRLMSFDWPIFFIQIPLAILICFYLPYNIVIVAFSLQEKTLAKKIIIFSIMATILYGILGSFSQGLFYPYWKNIYIILCIIPYASICATVVHFFVDKKMKIYPISKNKTI